MIRLLTDINKCVECDCHNSIDAVCGLSEILVINPEKLQSNCPLKRVRFTAMWVEGKQIVERVFIVHDNMTDHLAIPVGAEFTVLAEGEVQFVRTVTGLTVKVSRVRGGIIVSDISRKTLTEHRLYTGSYIHDLHKVLVGDRQSLTF